MRAKQLCLSVEILSDQNWQTHPEGTADSFVQSHFWSSLPYCLGEFGNFVSSLISFLVFWKFQMKLVCFLLMWTVCSFLFPGEIPGYGNARGSWICSCSFPFQRLSHPQCCENDDFFSLQQSQSKNEKWFFPKGWGKVNSFDQMKKVIVCLGLCWVYLWKETGADSFWKHQKLKKLTFY